MHMLDVTPYVEPRPKLKFEFPLDYIWVESWIIFLLLFFLSFIVASSHENSKIVSLQDNMELWEEHPYHYDDNLSIRVFTTWC